MLSEHYHPDIELAEAPAKNRIETHERRHVGDITAMT